MHKERGSRKRWGNYLIGVLFAVYTVVPIALFGATGIVVLILTGAAFSFILLIDHPKESLPGWLEWAMPLKGRWARWMVLIAALGIVLTMPFWAMALAR